MIVAPDSSLVSLIQGLNHFHNFGWSFVYWGVDKLIISFNPYDHVDDHVDGDDEDDDDDV